MRIGIGLPTRGLNVSGEFLVEWARRADQGGFSSLAVTDRVVYHAREPLIALAVAAAVTRRIRLLAGAIVVPTRETILLARQAASLDALSGGRFTLGVGVGVREDDYIATGFAFHQRGRRLDEQLPMLRRIWAGEPAAEGVGPIGPAPARPGGPEVLIGGYLPVVARRIAAWGDGFMSPGGGDQVKMQDLWGLIKQAWSEAGRPGRPRWVTGGYYALGPDAGDQATAYIQDNYGFKPDLVARIRRNIPTTPSAVLEAIKRRADMGADEYVLRPVVEDLPALDALANVIAGMAET